MSKKNPKSFEDGLAESNVARANMIARFGFVPLSVIREIHRGKLHRKMFVYQSEEGGRAMNNWTLEQKVESATNEAQREKVLAKAKRRGTLNVPNASSNNRSQLSMMPAELVEFFVKYYAKPGDVYLDPFMGQGIQLQVAKLLGLHYYGFDLSTEFFRYIDSVRSKIDDGKTVLNITHGDSRFPANIPDGIGDFSFHSPPYWDIEFYGEESGQLGHGQTYEEFLVGMRDVARAWLPKFKPGAFHVVNVNDFRRDGRFYSYHSDTIRIFVEAGWELIDTWIIEGLIGGLPKVFAVQFNERKTSPKIHEYALVFRKPGGKGR
jgi:hypothetical protein